MNEPAFRNVILKHSMGPFRGGGMEGDPSALCYSFLYVFVFKCIDNYWRLLFVLQNLCDELTKLFYNLAEIMYLYD